MKVGRILKIARVISDISAKEAAERIGVSRSYICEIENDKKPIKMDILEKYSEILCTKTYRIIDLAEENISEPDLRREVAKRLW